MDFLSEPDFENTFQEIGDLFLKKLKPKIDDLRTNFIKEQSNNVIEFLSNTQPCMEHPPLKLAYLAQVFKIEIFQRTHADHIYEEVSYYSCGDSTFLFKEIFLTYGENLKLMTRHQIVDLDRSLLLKKGETRKEYSVFTYGQTAIPALQFINSISSHTASFLMDNQLFFFIETGERNGLQWRGFSNNLPFEWGLNGSKWTYSGTPTQLKITTQTDQSPKYFINQDRSNYIDFQTKLNGHLKSANEMIKYFVEDLLKHLPQTKTVEQTSSNYFLIEFRKNLTKVQAGDFSTVKEFLERMFRGITNGKLVIQDNGF